MSSHMLIFLSIIVSIASFYLYINRDKVDQPKTSYDARFDYFADDIAAVQTDETGQVVLNISAEKLSHNLETDLVSLNNVTAMQYSDNATLEFKAKQGVWSSESNELELKENVVVTKKNKDNNLQTFTGRNVLYNTATKKMISHLPITFNADNSYVTAQSMQADLKTGLFSFSLLDAQYQPND